MFPKTLTSYLFDLENESKIMSRVYNKFINLFNFYKVKKNIFTCIK